MIYVEYEYLRRKKAEAEKRYDAILGEKEELFERTQPKGIRYDRDKVTGGEDPDKYAEYLITKERKKIARRLAEAKRLVEERREQLAGKEAELRASAETLDKVYAMRVLDCAGAEEIAEAVRYSRSRVYDFLKIIALIVNSDDIGQTE